MHFSQLAQTFRQLEETSSRTALTQILADLFRRTAPDEICPMTYLLQGRLAAAFVPLELGMGVQNVAGAIAEAYGTDRNVVLARFDQVGDLGTAAGQLAAESGASNPEAETPSVHQAFDRLVQIARLTGAGSIQQKVSRLAALLTEMDALSATFLCRIPLGTLRLGVGDLTVLDAYSVAQSGAKSLRARLSSAEAILEKLGPCAVENKYDGFRCQIHKSGDEVRIFSRSLEEMSAAFPELLTATRLQIGAQAAIFEGEALAYNPLSEEYLPFQQTMRRRRKHQVDATAAELPLRLFAFDVLYTEGENVTARSYLERRALLDRLIQPGETILVSASHRVDTPDGLLAIFGDAMQHGLEGIMAKKPESPYQAGARSYNWVKLKRAQAGHLSDTVDCVIVGYLYGRGRRAALGAGALLVAVYDPDRDVFPTVTKIGTGLKDADWRTVLERVAPYEVDHKPARVESRLEPSVWIEPAVVIEVLADEITRSPLYTAGALNGQPGYALRFPRLVSFREADKRPEDVTTVAEIVELYNQQGAKPVPG